MIAFITITFIFAIFAGLTIMNNEPVPPITSFPANEINLEAERLVNSILNCTPYKPKLQLNEEMYIFIVQTTPNRCHNLILIYNDIL